MQKILSWVLILLAFVPLVVAPNTISPYVDGKMFVFRLAAFVGILLFWIVVYKDNAVRTRVIQTVQQPLFIAAAISMLLLIVSTLFAYDRSVAFFGDPSRGEGLLTLFSIFILYGLMAVVLDEAAWNTFFVSTTIVSSILFIYEFWQLGHGINRPGSLLGNPAFLSGWYLFSLFAAFYGIARKRWRSWAWIAILVSIVGILLTKTRGTLLGISVAVVVVMVLLSVIGGNRTFKKMPIRTVAAWCAGILAAIALVFAATRHATIWERVPGFNRIGDTATVESRLLYWNSSITGYQHSTLQQKLLGWGWDNYQFLWNKNYDPTLYFYDNATVDRPHNKLLDLLIMTGVVGLLSYAAIWFFLIKKSLQIAKTELVIGTMIIFVGVAYFVHNFFAFDTPVTLFSFNAMLAYVTAYAKQ